MWRQCSESAGRMCVYFVEGEGIVSIEFGYSFNRMWNECGDSVGKLWIECG